MVGRWSSRCCRAIGDAHLGYRSRARSFSIGASWWAGVADHVVDPSTDNVVAEVQRLTNGRGADIAVDAAGVQPIFDTLLHILKVRGTLQVVALSGKNPTLDMNAVTFKELRVQASFGYSDDHEPVIQLVQDGTIDLAPFITRKPAVEDIALEAFQRLIDHKDDEVKILVHM